MLSKKEEGSPDIFHFSLQWGWNTGVIFLWKEPELQYPESSDLANYEDKVLKIFRNGRWILKAILLKCQLWQHMNGIRMIYARSPTEFFNVRNTFWVICKRLNISHIISIDLLRNLRRDLQKLCGLHLTSHSDLHGMLGVALEDTASLTMLSHHSKRRLTFLVINLEQKGI